MKNIYVCAITYKSLQEHFDIQTQNGFFSDTQIAYDSLRILCRKKDKNKEIGLVRSYGIGAV